MTERSRRVVLLIDYDNLQICAARDTPGRDLQLPPVVHLAQRYGTVVIARAYAEWNLSTERLAVYKAGIEPAFAPVLRTESDRSGKSLADTVMVAEGMDMLWELSPEVVVLATSDKDLIPLVRVAKQRGAFVVVLGSDFTAIPLREMADEHITYRQLITEAGVRYATEAGPGRQPAALPEPSRRRRDRNGRDRGTTSSSTAASATARPEREAAAAPPAQTAPAAPSQPASSAEPVAPVASVSQAEADGQTGSRRRRRRGSRRRSDRLGLTAAPEGQDMAPSMGEAEEAEPAPAPALESEARPVEAQPLEAEPVRAEEPAAPVTRRRRTRRTPTPSPDTESEQGGMAEPTPAMDAPPQSADIQPAPPPAEASANGAAAEPSLAEGGTEATPAPARRPRRVASASRGRTRRA